MAQLRRVTLEYKILRGVSYQADVYLPEEDKVTEAQRKGAPVLVYYHGGGMCCGNRGWNDWVGKWLFYDALDAGFIVISFDYTLISPDSAFQIIEDVKDGMLWIRDGLNSQLAEETCLRVDAERIAVSGASGGGCVAYYAALYSPIKLRAILAFYAEGGNFLLPWYIEEKTEPFFLGLPLITDFAPYEAIRDAPPDSPPVNWTDIVPCGPRSDYYYYLLQTAQAVDVFADCKGLSKELLELPEEERVAAVPENARPVLPHLNNTSSFPPIYLLHGVFDSVVSIEESRTMYKALKKEGVDVKLWEVEGGEHGFDTDGWFGGPGGQDPELTRKRNEGLKGVVPWLLERV